MEINRSPDVFLFCEICSLYVVFNCDYLCWDIPSGGHLITKQMKNTVKIKYHNGIDFVMYDMDPIGIFLRCVKRGLLEQTNKIKSVGH